MQKEILNSKYIVATYDDESKIWTSVYSEETKNMTNKEWHELMLKLKKIIEKHKPSYIIDDNRKRLFAYPPDIQNWTLKLFVKSWNKMGLLKYVQIIPEDIVGQISADQIDEQASEEFKLKFEHYLVREYDEAINYI
jgi:hypothetical protein